VSGWRLVVYGSDANSSIGVVFVAKMAGDARGC
jgi:hypothetical protein